MSHEETVNELEVGPIRSSVIRGLSWLGASKAVIRLLAFVKTIILARILTPAAFGVFGIASIVLEFLEVITETGINVFLVQEKEDIDGYIDTSFIVSIIRGILISVFIVITSGFISGFFNSPEAQGLILLIAVVPFVRGFINPSVVKFQKELAFNKEFWFRSGLFFIDTIVAVTLSIITRSPYALVVGMIVNAVFEVIFSFIIVKPTPKFKVNIEYAKEVVNRGKWVTLAGLFNYLFLHGDDIVVGKVLGQSSLGLYQVGYRISILPITEVAEVFGKVAFPHYVKIISDVERFKKVFFKMVGGISLLVVPFGLLLFFFTEPIVRIGLGSAWIGVVPALKVLAVYGCLKAILFPCYAVFFAAKKQSYVTLVTFVGIIGLFGSIFPLVNMLGIVGAAYAALVGTILTIPAIVICLVKVFNRA